MQQRMVCLVDILLSVTGASISLLPRGKSTTDIIAPVDTTGAPAISGPLCEARNASSSYQLSTDAAAVTAVKDA